MEKLPMGENRFRKYEQIIVRNDKLKTNGCIGYILGRHYNCYRWGDIASSSYDVKLDYHGKELITYITESSLEPYETK